MTMVPITDAEVRPSPTTMLERACGHHCGARDGKPGHCEACHLRPANVGGCDEVAATNGNGHM